MLILKTLKIHQRKKKGGKEGRERRRKRRRRKGGREGDARRRRYGDICICIADSLCYKTEANTPL